MQKDVDSNDKSSAKTSLALAANFSAGTAGSMLEQYISEGTVDVRQGITDGLHNAVDQAIYGNGKIKNLWAAVKRGARSGAAGSGLDYLSDVLKPRNQAGRSPAMPNPVAVPSREIRDLRSGCGIPSAFGNSMGYGSDYGYQYNVPMTGSSQEDRKGFNLGDFALEMLTGAVTSGVSSAAFYGGSKALETLKGSVKGGPRINPSIQIIGNSYDINKLQRTQPYTYPENVSSLKEMIVQNGPNSIQPIEIRVHNGQVLVVDGHHRLEAFRQLGYDRVPIKYLHSSQLGRTLSDGTYYRSIQELIDAAKISN